MNRLIATALSSFLTSSALAAELSGGDLFNRDYLTSNQAILCLYASDLKEASSAVIAGDENWLKELNCIFAKDKLTVRLIEPTWLGDAKDGRPWKVRVTLPEGRGLTMWGRAYAFTFPDGRKIPPDRW